MPSPELLPVLAGAILGSILAAFRTRGWTLLLAVLLGALATVASGEHHVSWAFVLIDTAIVAVSATVSYLVIRWMRGRRSTIL